LSEHLQLPNNVSELLFNVFGGNIYERYLANSIIRSQNTATSEKLVKTALEYCNDQIAM